MVNIHFFVIYISIMRRKGSDKLPCITDDTFWWAKLFYDLHCVLHKCTVETLPTVW